MRSSREQFGRVRDRFRFEAARFARLLSQLCKTIHPVNPPGAFLCTLLSDSCCSGWAVSTANHAIKSYFLLQEKSVTKTDRDPLKRGREPTRQLIVDIAWQRPTVIGLRNSTLEELGRFVKRSGWSI